MVSKIRNAIKLKIQYDKINSKLCLEKKIKLIVLRLDLIHEEYGGNKYFKLKYNLREAKNQKQDTLLTFGGAYSNHIAATAAAGKENNLKTIGVIRGEELRELNPTLQFAKACGMHLHFVSREDYKEKKSPEFLNAMKLLFGEFYVIPEGGSNLLALKGCAEIIESYAHDFDHICCPCGTGMTFSGILSSLKGHQKAHGFSSLKGGDFLKEVVPQNLMDYSYAENIESTVYSNWNIVTDYHFGGYGKATEELFAFADYFFAEHKIQLDYVYTAKMMFGIFDKIKTNYFPEGTTILALHTGGVQGNQGFLRHPL